MVLRRDLPFRFDERRRRAEDFMLWAQILLSGYRCVRIEPVLASWHKPPFGAGGLSGDLDAMYKAAVDVRRSLYQQGLVGGVRMGVAAVLGVARHARRRVLTYMRNSSATTRAERPVQS
jgi:hypothetical protein